MKNISSYAVIRVILCGIFVYLTMDFGLSLPQAGVLIALAMVISLLSMFEGGECVRR